MGSLLSDLGRVAVLVDDGDAVVRIADGNVGHAIAAMATVDRARVIVLDRSNVHAGLSAGAEGGAHAMQIAGAAAG